MVTHICLQNKLSLIPFEMNIVIPRTAQTTWYPLQKIKQKLHLAVHLAGKLPPSLALEGDSLHGKTVDGNCRKDSSPSHEGLTSRTVFCGWMDTQYLLVWRDGVKGKHLFRLLLSVEHLQLTDLGTGNTKPKTKCYSPKSIIPLIRRQILYTDRQLLRCGLLSIKIL